MLLWTTSWTSCVFNISSEHSFHVDLQCISSIFSWFHDLVQHIPTLQRRANMFSQTSVSFCSAPVSYLDCPSYPGTLPVWWDSLHLMVLGFLDCRNLQS